MKPWCSALLTWLTVTCVTFKSRAEPRLLADLTAQDFQPHDSAWCLEQPAHRCLTEFHTGRFDGAQQHRQAEATNAASDRATDGRHHFRLVALVTSIWRNFQRRQLLRNGLIWCRRSTPEGGSMTWRFLLGDAPKRLVPLALAELEKHDDVQLLGGPDEIDYRHVGDAYNLHEPNPELLKLIICFRRLRFELTYDYVLVADDDSFLSLSNALELTYMLPKRRVYVGNMIDTIPQRWHETRGIVQEYSVNIYLGSPSKVPIFAHGMGFLISADLAEMLAELGLSLKLRGNDDMLFGLWLRSIEHMHFLHYWPWFYDHKDFGGLFSLPCDKAAVVTHRMTFERWKTFDRLNCHICGDETPRLLEEEPLMEDVPGAPEDFEEHLTGGAPLGRSVRLAILIFGSRWEESRGRRPLRRALRCGGAAWRFVMGKTPPGPRKRQRALEEFLRQKDMVILRSQADGSYGYEHAWPIVEEQFGSADFVLFLDHRSFVNVNVILQLVEQLPQQKVMQGCLLEESLFAHGDKRSYLWRRRAPFFPHGMGFVMSKDVAKFLSEMAKKVPLRQAEMPVDVAVGMWVQLLEDMNFVSHQELFHELPVRFGVLSEQDSLELRRHPTPQTAVAWPMGPRWWETFDPQTCQLLRNHTEPAPRGRKPPVTVAPELNCWEGMGGRPEAWYLACCSLRWPGCWGGPYTAELCCANAPEVTLPDPPLGLETLQKFLQFQPHELQLFLSAVANASRAPVPVGPPGRIPCFAGADCAREAFVRFFLGLWREKLLPLRHPWLVEQEDHLLGVNLMLRQGNAGQQPPGQEHILDRVQMSHFLSTTSRRLQDPSFAWARASPRRCLEWDSGAYSRHFFSELCEVVDVVTYYGDGIAQRRDHGPKGKRDYLIDIHIADQVVPENSTALVVCAQVFEHLRQPFKAMRQIFRLMAPLGVLAFSAPLFSEIHGAPQDFWRFTPSGAKTLAEDAGFEVLEIYAPGSLRELSGYLLGMTRPYWQEEDLLRDSHGGWPLQVYMLARKPPR